MLSSGMSQLRTLDDVLYLRYQIFGGRMIKQQTKKRQKCVYLDGDNQLNCFYFVVFCF